MPLLHTRSRRVSPRELLYPLGLAVLYYLGARVGFLLTPREQPVSTLWPPNAIVLAALLLAPTRRWPILLAAVFPAHLLIELSSGVPIGMVLCWFVSNSLEALIGASGVRLLAPGPARLDTFRRVNVFVGCAALLAPFASSFVDAGFVALNDWGTRGYWDVWRARVFSNTLAVLTLVPVIIALSQLASRERRPLRAGRAIEGGLLVLSLIGVCSFVFTMPTAIHAVPALLYTPLPFLLWAAVRFGPAGASGCLFVFAISSVWGAIHGHGPFIGYPPEENVLSLQLFLIVTYIPLLALTAVLREGKRAAEDARRNEQQLNLALGAAHVSTWDWPLGVPSERYEQFIDDVHPEDAPLVEAALSRAVGDSDAYEVEFRKGVDGGRWELSKGRVVRDEAGMPVRMIGVTADITERKCAEAAVLTESMLRESAAQLRELANAMPQIVFTARADGALDFFNRKWYDLTGTAEGPISSDTWLSMIHPDDNQRCLMLWQANVQACRPHEHEARFRRASGEYRWHLVRALPVRNDDGTIRRWYGTATDIDDRKRAEDALRDSEAQLRILGEQLEHRVAQRTSELSLANQTLRSAIETRLRTEKALMSSEERFVKAFRASPHAIAITHCGDNRILEVNARWQDLFGFSRAEVIGRTAEELGLGLKDADRRRVAAMMAAENRIREIELDVHNRDGELLRVVLVCELVEVDGERCNIAMVRDITERRRSEQVIAAQRRQLAHLGRVAVLGELSGAIAHELNQPLTAILANARAAQRMMSRPNYDEKEICAILGDIATDDLRAGAVIRRMRDLIRNGDTMPQLTDANDIVREVLDLAHGDLMLREVAVTTRLAPSLPAVPADRVQLQQVLLNLVVNACDAMDENLRGDRSIVVVSAIEEAAIRLSVSDHGVGIPTDPVEAVFELFHTTKEHGLGLGLAICKSIVNAHGGRMWATNNADRGATFHLTLPTEHTSPTERQCR